MDAAGAGGLSISSPSSSLAILSPIWMSSPYQLQVPKQACDEGEEESRLTFVCTVKGWLLSLLLQSGWKNLVFVVRK